MSQDTLIRSIHDICRDLAGIDFDAADCLETVRRQLPEDSDRMREISRLMTEGLREGWICDRDNGPLKFSRVVKPSDDSCQFSCDAVYMPDCAGPRHTHPNGELSWCVSLEGSPDFDGNGPGWALYAPGTTHVPTVSNGTMLIIYFLPEGAVTWE